MKDIFIDELVKKVGEKRAYHSIGVMKTAIKLARIYDCDIEKARIAGILHDCAKYRDKSYLLKRANDFGIILDNIMLENTELIHGPLGAMVAKFEFGIRDDEILDAICYHTTGRKNMTTLDKIIYIADYIEPNRDFPGVDEARELAYKDLNKSLKFAMENTIIFLLRQGKLVHLDTIEARNYLVLLEKSE
ncbi:bis(5'-nucleosyl)-tetraphosphatase (symmetrical) YqeK [Tissierella sp. Yu-01]|uniref:bis(5'-nucleosyl)-tetraphosphatase (symmetrical) YqeK n=1 Tax=Tissierella sp. Yu-01 TaxID=3035694 RepID=UPI00240DE197|nr:bis(5'-nucleosyl)-tetraphosphatase (symmetrical) YqeK [Tissierella sp. Yu-01]WFA09505.1 bis(5'-nucleosyl)-tetraphosphatase (symmetrical) YqeK [Tissierella sp. Yu-01]